jgi:hypothetical protein
MPISSSQREPAVQGGTDSSEFRIPNSELEGSVELRIPSPQPSRLTPVPSDKILLPRRMLYVEAVLYVTLAATAFGLGYLTGRGGWLAASKEDADVQKRVPVEGKVLLEARDGAKRGDEGAVIIVLPTAKSPAKRLPTAGLRPGDPLPAVGDATSAALAEFGGAVARADASGAFTLFVPAAGAYRILIISRQATGEPVAPFEKPGISELGKYFDAPADLIQQYRCVWRKEDLQLGAAPVNVEFQLGVR